MTPGDARPAQRKLPASVERRIAVTRGILWFERVWDAAWPASGIVLALIALSLFDVWSSLPALVHTAVLVLAAGASAVALVRTARSVRPPTRAEAIRRLEAASALDDRPLETVNDTLSEGGEDPATRALWLGAQRQAAAALDRLRTAAPRSQLGARDPQALRFAALLLVAVGLALAGPDRWDRIAEGLTPTLGHAPAHPLALDAWIDPPPYAGLPPIFLARGAIPPSDDNIPAVPEDAKLTMRLHGAFSRGKIELKAVGHARQKTESIKLVREKSGALAATVPLTMTSEVILRAGGRELGRWPVNVIPDQPPQIAFDGEIKATSRAALRIPYKVSDDFGLKSIVLEIRLAGESGGEVLTLPLSVPSDKATAARPARMRAYKDLSAHPWAGAEVVMTLTATDAKGQDGVSAPLTIALPERHFSNPLARALVDARRRLALRADGAAFASGFLDAATGPAAPPIEMSAVFLSLRLAYQLLTYAPTAEKNATASDLMWNAALALENGRGTGAERDLQAAKDALAKALRENAPQDEIAQKLQALRDALNQYLDELSQQLAQAGALDPQAPLDPNLQTLTPQDFENMLKALENLARTGANEQAEQLLGALDDLLQNLQPPGTAQQQPSPQDQARQQAMNELGDIIGDQRKLMDDTHRGNEGEDAAPRPESPQRQQGRARNDPSSRQDQAANDAPPPPQPQQSQPGEQGKEGAQAGGEGANKNDRTESQTSQSEQGGGKSLAERQEELRQRLGNTMESLGEGTGELPSALGRAERAMKDAQKALRDGNQPGAVENQKEALEALRDGAQSIAKAMDDAQRQAGGSSGRTGRGRMDPFGRPVAGAPDVNSAIDMPDKGEVQRAREILNEIRRRAAERGRPQSELDYLDRLLERF